MCNKLLISNSILFFGIIFLLGACAVPHNDVMVFGTETKFALDVSAQPQNASIPEFTLGYKRKEFVWMPLYVNGIDSKLASHIRGNTLIADDNTNIVTPKGADPITLEAGLPTFFPEKTMITFDDQTSVSFSKGTLVALSEGDDLTIYAETTTPLRPGTIIGLASGAKLDGVDIEHGKYLSTEMVENNLSHDTYSVLATFGSSVKLSNSGESGVGIAQYFATGLAARNLTSKGDSGLVAIKSATVSQVEDLKKEKKTLQTENKDLLIQNIGLEKSKEIQAAAKNKVTNDAAKVQLIISNVTDETGKLDKNKFEKVVDSLSIPDTQKKRIKGYANLATLESGLKTRDNTAINPIFEKIYNVN
jgi:hypothetical protein